MAMKRRRAWIVAYDVRDGRRVQRVHRYVSEHACMVQYSVYLFEGDVAGVIALLAGLRAVIEPDEDDVRVYPIPERAELYTLGRGTLPEQTWFEPNTNSLAGRLLRPAEPLA